MKLFNTLTRQVEELRPLNSLQVSIYTCGPTVYDYLHVGNWFTYIREDILLRTLQQSGLQTKWVMNITDVGHLVSDADEGEDKLEKGAKREGKTAWDVAKFYTDYFEKGMRRLNIMQPEVLPRATDHVAEQVALVQTLETKGFTYVISDGVYYDTSKFPAYSNFARLDIDEQQAGARVEYNQQKRNPTDFALWKFSPINQTRDMEWESPWGKGFPGWHIECSAMSMKYLGETLDIHAGGIDHIPVHHTNEIAQSEAATGKQFARHWMHTNHITIEGERIAKSLGNGITLEDIESKGISLQAFRLHVLESHYRSQSKFSWDSLQAAQNRLNNWQSFADLRFQPLEQPVSMLPKVDLSVVTTEVQTALEDDLATPRALATIDTVIGKRPTGIAPFEVEAFTSFIAYIDTALGLTLGSSTNLKPGYIQKIQEREEAKKNKDWTMADIARETLEDADVLLRDTPYGTLWSRKS